MGDVLERRTSLERLTQQAAQMRQAWHRHVARPVPAPSMVQKQQMGAVDSMCFLAPVNSRHAARAARGTRQSTTSISAELAQWLMLGMSESDFFGSIPTFVHQMGKCQAYHPIAVF